MQAARLAEVLVPLGRQRHSSASSDWVEAAEVLPTLQLAELEATVARLAAVVVAVEPLALDSSADQEETAATDTLKSLCSKMRLVQPDYMAGTYTGPWLYPDDGQIPPGLITEQAAVEAGLKQYPLPVPVPEAVPAWALSAVLDARGKLAELQAAIDKITPASTRTRVQWLFRRGEQFERDGDVVNSLGAAIGYTPAQVDQLFRDAESYANA